jgi:hypothetical protein
VLFGTRPDCGAVACRNVDFEPEVLRPLAGTEAGLKVIGKWKVAIHDNTHLYQLWERPYYVLSPGDVYNMKTRTIENYGNGSPVPPPVIGAK